MLTWRAVRRLAKVVAGVFVVVCALVATQQNIAATSVVVVLLLAVGAFLWWRRQPDAALSVVALVLACAATAAVTDWAAAAVGQDAGVRAGLAFWIFAGVLTVASWTSRRHLGRRGVTTALANGVLIACSFLVVLAPGGSALLGLFAGMLVVAWRSGGWLALRRIWWRHRPLADGEGSPTARPGTVTGADRTAGVVNGTGQRWYDLGSRRPDRAGAVVDHVLVGPHLTLLLHTRAWGGRVALHPGVAGGERSEARGQTYALDGDPRQLAERLRAIVRADATARLLLDESPESLWSVVVLWDTTELPEGVVEVDVVPESEQRFLDPARVVLLRGERLGAWLADVATTAERGSTAEHAGRVAARMLPAS